jgi:hypothetical protein
MLQQPGCLDELSMLQASEICAKILPQDAKSPSPLCSAGQLAQRLWQALAIIYELDKDGDAPLEWDTSCTELPKWVKALRKLQQGGAASETLHRWQVEKLCLDDRWKGLWKDAGQLLEYNCKRRLTDWLPPVQEIPRAPAFNVPGRQAPASDKVLKNIDDHLRELARAVRALHMTFLSDPALPRAVADTAAMTGQPLVVPTAAVQIENLFTLLGCCSVYCGNQRLRGVDTRLEVETTHEEGLVGKEELARLEKAQRLQAKMPNQRNSNQGKGRFQPYLQRQNGWSGKGKGGKSKGGRGKGGKGGKGGRGKGFVFPAPTEV